MIAYSPNANLRHCFGECRYAKIARSSYRSRARPPGPPYIRTGRYGIRLAVEHDRIDNDTSAQRYTAVPNANAYKTRLGISTHTGYNRYVIMPGKIASILNRTFIYLFFKIWLVQVMHGSVYNNRVFAEGLNKIITSGSVEVLRKQLNHTGGHCQL